MAKKTSPARAGRLQTVVAEDINDPKELAAIDERRRGHQTVKELLRSRLRGKYAKESNIARVLDLYEQLPVGDRPPFIQAILEMLPPEQQLALVAFLGTLMPPDFFDHMELELGKDRSHY